MIFRTLISFSLTKNTACMSCGIQVCKALYVARLMRLRSTEVLANALGTTTAERPRPPTDRYLADMPPRRTLRPSFMSARTSAARRRADFRIMIIPRDERGPCVFDEVLSCAPLWWPPALKTRAHGRAYASLVGTFVTYVNHNPSTVSPQVMHLYGSFDAAPVSAYACEE